MVASYQAPRAITGAWDGSESHPYLCDDGKVAPPGAAGYCSRSDDVTTTFPRRVWWLFPALQAAVALIVVFLLPRDVYLSAPDTDLATGFLSSRAFAAESLRAWHVPLWNPYVYGGEPFLGGFESAVLYPPTLIFVCLPLDRAMNLSLLGHLLILGWGMQYWAARRGLHPLAAALACLGAQLSGPVWPHLYAGHLSNLCTMAWAPWLFAFLDDWRRDRAARELPLAAVAVCLQILGGHVQYVFYTGIAAGIFAGLHTAWAPARWRRELPAVAVVYAAGALLAAAQLLPGFEAASEGVRSGGTDYAFARMFSFPPENLLTLIAPGFFGNLTAHVYWGRCYLWEMSVFAGATGVVLAAIAAADARSRRDARLALAGAALLGVLALGDHTPLFRLLYEHAPFFGSFRGTSKFTFPAVLFFVLTLAMGADALARGRLPARGVALGAAGLGLLAGSVGVAVMRVPAWFTGLPPRVLATGESYLPPAVAADPAFDAGAASGAAWALAQVGGVLLLAGGSLWMARRRPVWRWVPLAVLPVEWAVFAHAHFATCHLADAGQPDLRRFLQAHPGDDYRVLNFSSPNNGFLLGKGDLWGNNPGVLRRYAELIAATQGLDFHRPGQYVSFRSLPEVYSMLRLRYAFVPAANNGWQVVEAAPPMGRVQLVSEYAVAGDPAERLAALRDDLFDPRRKVVLETPPDPMPQVPAFPGRVRVVDSTPDTLTVEASVSAPTLLFNTDPYSRGWQVRALPGSDQQDYQLMPADHALRAVPLRAGHHLLRLEYHPPGFGAGRWLSGLAWAGWIVLAYGWFAGSRSEARRMP